MVSEVQLRFGVGERADFCCLVEVQLSLGIRADASLTSVRPHLHLRPPSLVGFDVVGWGLAAVEWNRTLTCGVAFIDTKTCGWALALVFSGF